MKHETTNSVDFQGIRCTAETIMEISGGRVMARVAAKDVRRIVVRYEFLSTAP